MKLKAILFDLDGTIRDTREIIYPALEHAIKVHTGKTPTRAEIKPYVHHHTEVHKALAHNVLEEDFVATYTDQIEAMRSTMKLYPEASELINQLHAKGYKLGMVTTAATGGTFMAEQGMDGIFDVIVGGNDTNEHKPHPAPVFKALELLDVRPAEAIMIGDLSVDIQAANGAGIKTTIAITHGFGSMEELKQAGATYIVDSLKEVLDVISRIEAINE